ncbi:MAG: leucine-rich repeat domain-containing protein [Verrucomicrobiales bacterium]
MKLPINLVAVFTFVLLLATLPLHAADINDLAYEVRGAAVTITGCDTAASGDLVIPPEIEGKSVTVIVFEAFIDCSFLTRVVIPQGVKSISKGTFAYCRSLRSVVIPEGVTAIRDGAFAYCSALEDADLPDNLRTLGRDAFLGCTNLPSVRIPDQVLYISPGVFAHCHNLTNVILPERMTLIGDYAFYECLALPNINIPINVKSIGLESFMYCESLVSVRIPEPVTRLGNGCFAFCRNLESVMFEGDAPELGPGVFFGLPAEATVTYAAGAAGFHGNSFGGIIAIAGEIPDLNPSMARVMMTVNPDKNGSETTWEVTDESGQIYGSGGPYSDFSFNPEVFRFHVPYNKPLRITVHDTAGDGLGDSGGLHLGTWSLTHGDTVLASGGGNFGSEQSAAVSIPGVSGLPVIISVTGEGAPRALTSFNITFASNKGWTYAVDRSRDLGIWDPLSGKITGEEDTTEFTDNDPILDGKGVFYRVRKVNN